MASSPASSYDCSFKVLLIGDSAVGKSSLLVSFVSAAHIDDDIAPTIGTRASAAPIPRWISPIELPTVAASLFVSVTEHDTTAMIFVPTQAENWRLLLGRVAVSRVQYSNNTVT
jgi:GTPase SAR1 family protein